MRATRAYEEARTLLESTMKLIKPFRGLRPSRELAVKVASHPYDVLNREEAFELAKDNPLSFLHINKPEVDMDVSVASTTNQFMTRVERALSASKQRARCSKTAKRSCMCTSKLWERMNR